MNRRDRFPLACAVWDVCIAEASMEEMPYSVHVRMVIINMWAAVNALAMERNVQL